MKLGWLLAACVVVPACGGAQPAAQQAGPTPLVGEDPGAVQGGPTAIPYPVALASAAPAHASENDAPVTLPPPPASATTYEIDQAIDDVTGSFAGKATITYTNTTGAPLATLPLLLHPNASAELGVSANEAGSLAAKAVTMTGGKVTLKRVRPTLVNVKFAAPIAPNAKVTFSVRYGGKLRKLGADANDMMGQAMSSMGSATGGNHAADYGLLAVGDGLLTAASAYPMVAPYREGSFDTTPPPRFGDLAYNAIATYHVRTIVPAGLHLVTNLVDKDPTPTNDGKEIVVSDGSYVRDFVLVAGRDLEHESKQVGHTRVSSWFRARDAKGGHAVLAVGTAALASYEKRFGPYPWPELDLAEASIVGGAGGVEFCAMALIAGMFYRPPDLSNSPLGAISGMMGGSLGGVLGGNQASPTDLANTMVEEQLEFVVVHEVAHQYFAGVVGNDSRRFAAVDEPMAQYASILALEDRHGRSESLQASDKNVKMNYALMRALDGPDRAAQRDTKLYSTPVEYAGLVYGKAPFVYAALRKKLGDDGFERTLRGAVAKSSFKIVTMDEWIDALEASSPGGRGSLRPLFHRYMYESHGDQDLQVDDSGQTVLASMMPAGMGDMTSTFAMMGMRPKQLVKMIFGGGLPSMGGAESAAGAAAPAFDPETVVKQLQKQLH